MSSQKGVTLIELMIAIGVLAIIATMAVPSMQKIIDNNRVTSQANAILSAITLARSEAVKRGVNMSFVAVGADYTNGWCVRLETAADCSNAVKAGETSDGIIFGGPTTITFDARGQKASGGSAEETVTLQPDHCITGEIRRREIDINVGGRARIEGAACP